MSPSRSRQEQLLGKKHRNHTTGTFCKTSGNGMFYCVTVYVMFLSVDLDGVAQWMETSVISGEPLAAILGKSVATNTFLIRKARTGSPGSLDLGLGTASAACRKVCYRHGAQGTGTIGTRFSELKILPLAKWTGTLRTRAGKGALRQVYTHLLWSTGGMKSFLLTKKLHYMILSTSTA